MSEATNTTLGTIKLAGDLAGSNDAANPRLTDSGVTAGIYTYPKITIDAKGRITNAVNGSSSDLGAIIPAATHTEKGIVQIGTNVNVTTTGTAATYNVQYGGALNSIADLTTEQTLLGPGLFSISIVVNGALVSKTVTHGVSTPIDTYSHLFSTLNTLFTGVATFGKSTSGNIVITSVVTGVAATIRKGTDTLLSSLANFVSWPDASGVGSTIIDGSGVNTISVNNASSIQKGVVQIGTGLSASGGVVSFDASTIAKASTSDFGIVKVGSGISVSAGVISATGLSDATTSSKGVVQVGSGLNVASGVLSLAPATSSVLGGIKAGTGFNIDGSGVLTFNSSTLATVSTPGLVQIGAGLAVDGAGVISFAGVPDATTSSKGIVQVGTGLSVASGVVSFTPSTLPDATTSSKGIVQVGTGLSVASGVVSVNNSSLPDATTSTKGVVQVGSGLAVSSGVMSVLDATTSTKGVVQVGSGLAVSSGVISTNLSDATTSTKGVVQVGTGLSVTSGVLNVDTSTLPNATTSTKGVVQVGNGLSVSSGTLSLALPTSSTRGGIIVGTNLSIDTLGVLSVSTAGAASASAKNTWVSGLTTQPVIENVSGTYTPNTNVSNTFILTLTGNTTLVAGLVTRIDGQRIKIIIIQDPSTPYTLGFLNGYNNWKFDTNGSTITPLPGAIDIINIVVTPSEWLSSLVKNFA